MARRHKLWARATRARMVLSLGGRCAACGSTEDLTFDCIEPMGHAHHAGSAPDRITFYRRQMLAGNVQLLCSSCNSLKGDLRMWAWLAALGHLHAEEALLSPSAAPGRGPAMTPADRLKFLRNYLAEVGRS